MTITQDDIRLLQGMVGFGGFSGHFGQHTDPELVRSRFYATRKDRNVLVESEDERIVISPDHPDRFVEELLKFKQTHPN